MNWRCERSKEERCQECTSCLHYKIKSLIIERDDWYARAKLAQGAPLEMREEWLTLKKRVVLMQKELSLVREELTAVEAERAEFDGYLKRIHLYFDRCNYSELPEKVITMKAKADYY